MRGFSEVAEAENILDTPQRGRESAFVSIRGDALVQEDVGAFGGIAHDLLPGSVKNCQTNKNGMSMSVFLQIIAITFVVVYIVDLSGFTESWRSALAKFLKTERLKSLKPFDCSKCLVFWVVLVWLLVHGENLLICLVAACLLSYLSETMRMLLIFIREGLNFVLRKLIDKI